MFHKQQFYKTLLFMTDTLEQSSPSQEASQEIPHLLCNPRFITVLALAHCWTLPLTQMNPVHILAPCFFKSLINIILPSTLMSPKYLFP
jgi:hypothetical protein